MSTALRRVPAHAAIAVLAIVSALLVAAPPHAAHASTDASTVASLVNRSRAEHGLPTLTVVAELSQVAQSHSGDMARRAELHHNPDLTTQVTNWRRLSENVGVGSSLTSLHNAFLSSAGHRANILDREVTELGVGVVRSGDRYWVTHVFRLPERASAPSSTASAPSQQVPSGSDTRPLIGDWNGDGIATPGWYVDGTFHLSDRLDGRGPLRTFTYGRHGDIPLVGDWNGDGIDTVGIVRDGEWHLVNSHRGGRSDVSFTYGRVLAGDIPLVGDWNGDGIDTAGIVRDGEWHLINRHRGGASDVSFVYGRILRGDIPLVGDWNGDGIDTAGIIRDGEWHLINRHRSGRSDVSFIYGRTSQGDTALTGDWNGDGRTTVAVTRDGTWHFRTRLAGGRADLSYVWKAG